MKEKKALFFSFQTGSPGGAAMIDERNLEVLTNCGYETSARYSEYTKLGAISKLILMLKVILGLRNRKDEEKAKAALKATNAPVVFLSHSFFGYLAKFLKKRRKDIRIISFFHNVESELTKARYKKTKNPIELFRYLFFLIAEKQACKYSDIVFALTPRDRQSILHLYKCSDVILFPTSLKDRKQTHEHRQREQDNLKVLFVGTNFFANKEGVVWMYKNVIPFADAKFIIVGKGMDNIVELNQSAKLLIKGEVTLEELDSFYSSSDLFISPLFSGGGMKTKIAEAMMFGLPIIGTYESFIGYDLRYSEIGIKTDSAEEMINFINKVASKRSVLEGYSHKARKLFEEKYSISASEKIFKSALTKI